MPTMTLPAPGCDGGPVTSIDAAIVNLREKRTFALQGSHRDYFQVAANHPQRRAQQFHQWMAARVEMGVYPYARCLLDAPRPVATLRSLDGTQTCGLNFASHDYLSLATHPRVLDAAMRAMHRFGVHSAGSSTQAGNSCLGAELESELAVLLHKQHAVLFPTGWAAGFGAVKGLIRRGDHVILDQCVRGGLREGAVAATRNVHLHRHLDLAHARRVLERIRSRDTANSVMLVAQSVYASDSEIADLRGLQALASEFDAILLVDVAHDLGCMGPGGTGQIGLQGLQGKVDLVVGSLSKAFASNGGFVATDSMAIKEYLRQYASPNAYSSALSPIQIAVAIECVRILRTREGEERRNALMRAITALRGAATSRGLPVLGQPSAVVPILLGDDAAARLASREMTRLGLMANLTEFPAAPRNAARLRMLAMADHTAEQCIAAIELVEHALGHARIVKAHLPAM
ncbi:aminotransferase class I/II-fold pyridoxal phosphate-dependent enzyme [Cupriavidus sp. CV2]|uniref:aminotransferase class I/II-fold pyridoxal phosphate-dependent enzyme n=1 Tax=Cupriavidus ulmosensis TaxID=3065913 RepID=UPI00296B462D|nr:aminotransferase class I/II-fold pyridoxal phosphate-dependent enzyme [Cupriavidus sp. CV2]MDW3687864.1 aminotransferase class I/II-fold pyridoxal phosphate-dependent enzyme [Cupriavidus sp. CV2]